MDNNFSRKCEILAELWMNYRNDENFSDFIEYNDLGLPLAYMSHTGLATPSDEARALVDETYNLFLSALNIQDKEEYQTLNDLFRDAAEE